MTTYKISASAPLVVGFLCALALTSSFGGLTFATASTDPSCEWSSFNEMESAGQHTVCGDQGCTDADRCDDGKCHDVDLQGKKQVGAHKCDNSFWNKCGGSFCDTTNEICVDGACVAPTCEGLQKMFCNLDTTTLTEEDSCSKDKCYKSEREFKCTINGDATLNASYLMECGLEDTTEELFPAGNSSGSIMSASGMLTMACVGAIVMIFAMHA